MRQIAYTARLVFAFASRSPLVAQLDRAPGFEPGCREFESLWADQFSVLTAQPRINMYKAIRWIECREASRPRTNLSGGTFGTRCSGHVVRDALSLRRTISKDFNILSFSLFYPRRKTLSLTQRRSAMKPSIGWGGFQ